MARNNYDTYYFRGRLNGQDRDWAVTAVTQLGAWNRLHACLQVNSIPRLGYITKEEYRGPKMRNVTRNVIF